ncbi:GH25 family lysozyme [Bifidobacterium avesanii]|uniref:Glycosyl hydrolase family 25 n=1 Tax=Bifidobacterium avesanii TaxID=1798157 RepID=A0A7K3TK74_9BIFI|nr:GH25 family lysozyme [Bifidobacterium avesanii]KAB8291918.1 1 4-beta-N-acetylmuramidase [Bifidobacterium avesanii]NEG79020.1 hypothetical protein [Bifidobacterium avesanii]
MKKNLGARLTALGATAVAVCMTAGFGLSGASADAFDGAAWVVSAQDQSGQTDQAQSDQAAAQELPETVSEAIPDDATIVSPDLAVTNDGTVKDVKTGDTVTDPRLVGTEATPPDPLEKTDGKTYIPVSVQDAKEAKDAEANGAGTADAIVATAEPVVSFASYVDNGQSGQFDQFAVTPAAERASSAYWGTYNGSKAFFQGDGQLFVQRAKKVIDVSRHNGTIDWQAAKNAGVEGAIIRIGFGASNDNVTAQMDSQAQRNISECKRLGIPFGVYLYSYADTTAMAADEGEYTVRLLKKFGVSPSNLSYPVYYDLEQWTWTGHKPPTSPSAYEQIARAWYAKLQNAGYGSHLGIYSYTSYLNGPLNASYIHERTTWVAQYSSRITYTAFSSNWRGWQYTSVGSINGVGGSVDVNAFGQRTVTSSGNSNSGGSASKPNNSKPNVSKPTYTTKGAIGIYRNAHAWLGSPTANELKVKGGASQSFQNGTVFWESATGNTYATKGGIQGEYASLRWEQGILGFPSSDERQLRGGASQSFAHGQIHWTQALGAHFTRGAIQDHWAALGWENGWLGYPTGDELTVRGGASQTFQGGTQFWSPSTGTQAVKGGILSEYANLRWEQGILGFPTSEERRLNNGASQSFQNGQIHWTPTAGAHFTRGGIQNYWASTGWENSWLGYPTSGEQNTNEGVTQIFQHGAVHWRRSDGHVYTSAYVGRVHRGAFCSANGAVGNGDQDNRILVCATASDGRLRWRNK